MIKPIDQCTSQPSLQELPFAADDDEHRDPYFAMCRELEATECSTLIGIYIPHSLAKDSRVTLAEGMGNI